MRPTPHRRPARASALAVSVAWLTTLAIAPALLANHTPVKLLDTSTPLPGTTETVADFIEPAIEGDLIAIWVAGDAGLDANEGVYAVLEDGIAPIADTTMTAPGFGTPFQNFDPSGHTIGDDGVVVVWGAAGGGSAGLYTWTPGSGLAKLIDTDSVVEGGELLSLSKPTRNAGANAYLASNFEVSGVFTDVFGEVENIFDSDTPVPGLPGASFLTVNRPRLAGTSVAFKATTFGGPVSFQRGFYAVHKGQTIKIADALTNLPGSADTFVVNPFLRTSIALEGTTAVFVAESDKSAFGGVYRFDLETGAIDVITDQNTTAPASGGLAFGQVASGFGLEVAMRDGIVVFDTNEGVYAAGPEGMIRVVGIEDIAEAGQTLFDIEIGPDSYDGESIAFVARGFDNYRALWRIDVPGFCAEDVSGDGEVDADDLNVVLEAFANSALGDVDGDGDTDTTDLNRVLWMFGGGCDGTNPKREARGQRSAPRPHSGHGTPS